MIEWYGGDAGGGAGAGASGADVDAAGVVAASGWSSSCCRGTRGPESLVVEPDASASRSVFSSVRHESGIL